MTEKTTTPAENIYAALAAAQAEFKPVVKNCVNPAFGSKYADLQSILDATRPVLNRHGLFLFQRVMSSRDGVSVETCVSHASGETLSSGVLFLPVISPKNPSQAFGSAETYARRYSLSAFLGVSADEDDDGNGAKVDEQTLTNERLASALVDVATEAANRGMAAYKDFYACLTPAARKALNAAGVHSELKVVAESVDEKSQAQAPQAIQQAAPAEIETKSEE
jgi:hypothetical protein|nr:MAG TPA_asm: ERF superfamily protein [Caudoviricetes sp.]